MRNCLDILRKRARTIRKMLEISGICEKVSFFISFFHSCPYPLVVDSDCWRCGRRVWRRRGTGCAASSSSASGPSSTGTPRTAPSRTRSPARPWCAGTDFGREEPRVKTGRRQERSAPSNFGRLILGCIDADFRDQILVSFKNRKLLTRSTNCTFFS